ncbi:MAG: DinB family protein [Bacteroidetes bacterium]|nr:DinB family protein [Bacteroidota bacterium]
MSLPSSITTRLQYQHKSLLDLIEGLTDEQVRQKIIAGKWSIFENIVHLQTYQHVFIYRVKEILKGVNPQFDRYSAENDPYFSINCNKSTREAMQDLLSQRKDMAMEINNISDEDLLKSGTHPVFGQMKLHQWLNFFLLHEAHHLFTIFKLTAELKKEQ